MQLIAAIPVLISAISLAHSTPVDLGGFGVNQTVEIAHGNQFQFQNQTMRMWEILKDVYTGVPADEWDDNVHVASNVEVDYSSVETRSFEDDGDLDPNFDNPLLERNLRETCRARVNCMQAGLVGKISTVYNLGVKAIESAAAVKKKDVWELLNRPFLAANLGNFGGVGGQNMAVTAWSHWMWPTTPKTVTVTVPTTVTAPSTDPTPPPGGQCSTTGSSIDILESLVRRTCSEYRTARSWQVNVPYSDGSVLFFSMNAGPGNSIGGSQVCGAPGIQGSTS